MKKLTTILLAITVLAFSFALSGCESEGTFTAENYSAKKGEVESITIDVFDREIEISPSKDDEIHIDYFESDKEFYEISVSKNGELAMTLVKDKDWTDFVETKPDFENRKIKVQIPNSLLASLEVSTTNEKIWAKNIEGTQKISLATSGGDIELERVDPGKELTLLAKNGNVLGSVVGSYDVFAINCEIKKGECNLPLSKTDGEKSLNANCNNGDIQIDFVKG